MFGVNSDVNASHVYSESFKTSGRPYFSMMVVPKKRVSERVSGLFFQREFRKVWREDRGHALDEVHPDEVHGRPGNPPSLAAAGARR